MEFTEEEIVRTRKEALRKKNRSIYDKYLYIGNERLEFTMQEVIPPFVRMMFPKTFLDLPLEFAKKMYSSEQRPAVIKTNPYMTVNFAFTFFDAKLPMNQVANCARFYLASMKRMYSGNKYLDNGGGHSGAGSSGFAGGGSQLSIGGTGKAGGEKSPGAKRSDPDYKTIRTTSGKMVELSPQGIILDSGDGMRVELNEKKGISIVSHLGITIETPELVNISSLEGKVEIVGAEGVDLNQGTGKIEVASDNVVFYGANSKVR